MLSMAYTMPSRLNTACCALLSLFPTGVVTAQAAVVRVVVGLATTTQHVQSAVLMLVMMVVSGVAATTHPITRVYETRSNLGKCSCGGRQWRAVAAVVGTTLVVALRWSSAESGTY